MTISDIQDIIKDLISFNVNQKEIEDIVKTILNL